MANPNPNHLRHHHLAAMLLALLLLTSSPSSFGRPLSDDYFSLAASERSLNLALPTRGERVVVPAEEEAILGHVSRCGHMRVAGGKYGALTLNMLPKGTVPPSGPSKGTNNVNN